MSRQHKNALVTGGTDGIGKQVALRLAQAGHRVLVVGRDPVKGERAAQEIRSRSRNADVHFLQTDLSRIRETNLLADELAERWSALHYLVHSAGIVRARRELTDEGVESNFAVNYLSRFALTWRLLPLLAGGGRPGETARVVILGGAAQNGRIYFDDPNLTSTFGTLRAIGQVCQANDVFTVELARRLAVAQQPRITVTCLKIGVVKANIRKEFPRWMKWLVPLVFDPLLGQTPQEAAAAALRLLTSSEFEGETGALFLKIRRFKRIDLSARTQDPEQGRRLWELSERLCSSVLGSSKEAIRIA